MLYLLREDFAEKLRVFTAAGGTLAVTSWSDAVDEHDRCWLGDAPHGLTETLGLRRAEIDSMYDGETRRCAAVGEGVPREAFGGTLCEVSVLEGAEPLMVYEEDFFKGAPAMARNACGEGTAFYLVTRVEPGFYREFYGSICRKTFKMPWTQPLPEGVLATVQGNFLFMQNTGGSPVSIGGKELPPFGTMVCKLPSENGGGFWEQIVQDGLYGVF
nr:beta-galactosidase trimerization domain-containing protein [uncultured Oscillibacter sp.]